MVKETIGRTGCSLGPGRFGDRVFRSFLLVTSGIELQIKENVCRSGSQVKCLDLGSSGPSLRAFTELEERKGRLFGLEV